MMNRTGLENSNKIRFFYFLWLFVSATSMAQPLHPTPDCPTSQSIYQLKVDFLVVEAVNFSALGLGFRLTRQRQSMKKKSWETKGKSTSMLP